MVNENALVHLKGEKGKVACGTHKKISKSIFKLLYVNNCITYVLNIKLKDILGVDIKNTIKPHNAPTTYF